MRDPGAVEQAPFLGADRALVADRERGRFRLFKCKAAVLATGGVGRAFSITSNSWEYTADGQSLAYNAGAAPILEACSFEGNSAYWGGGAVYNSGASPSVTGCSATGA